MTWRTGSSECVPKLPVSRVVVNAVMPNDSKSGTLSRSGSSIVALSAGVSSSGPRCA
jgi:hypothetical protein